LIPEHFPALFGPKGNEPLDPEASSVKFKELAETVELLFILFDNFKYIYLYIDQFIFKRKWKENIEY